MRRVLLLLALFGCKAFLNKDFTHEPAPQIGGGTWIWGNAPTQEWKVVTFFDPQNVRSAESVPRLTALRKEFKPTVTVIAITRASKEDAMKFAKAHGIKYAIQSDGAMAFEKWGIGSIDHAPVYLVDPNGWVLAEGFEKCAETLRERLGSREDSGGAGGQG
jgi:peroxiredoxin